MEMLVTAIGNIGRWLVQFADWLDEKYSRAPKTIAEQLEAAGWTKRLER
jgi:hypothetical protein